MSEGLVHAPQRVIGRYALYGEIAAGGMATVHIGRLLGPVGFSRTVAIKRLHPQFAKDPEFVSMFLDEARVAARIQHPNVVSTLDVVALEGELFLVMEYVEGESFARILRGLRAEKKRMPPKLVGAIACNILYGLHAAHEAKSERGEPLGLVHRDVSPQNVLVGVDGVARVLDFGVAKAAGRVQTTREGQVKGKLAYMPPEQLAGEKVDRRLDVYAASVVLWEALTSQRLFDGDNDGVVLQRVLTSEVQKPSIFADDLPPGLDEIVLRGLARNPDKRYQTAREMAVDLEDVLGVDPPRKVGEFVERCAGEQIAKRIAKIKEIESVSSAHGGVGSTVQVPPEVAAAMGAHPLPHASARESVATSPMQVALPAVSIGVMHGALAPAGGSLGPEGSLIPEGSSSTRLSSVSTPVHREGRRGRMVVMAGLLLLLVGVPIAIFASRYRAAPVDAAAAAAEPTGDRRPAEPTARPDVADKVAGDKAAPSAAPGASASASSAPSSLPSTRAPARVAAPPALPRPPAVSCNPPYVMDGGIRKLKPECVK